MIELSRRAVAHNVALLRSLLGGKTKLGVVVKADAYGHGAVQTVPLLVDAGVDWLITNSAAESVSVRALATTTPIYSCGPLSPGDAAGIVAARARTVVSTAAVADALARESALANTVTPVHIKIETGTSRQGVFADDALSLATRIADSPSLRLEGVTTHFADIEDTTDHRFADAQHDGLLRVVQRMRDAGHTVDMVHAANSAATLLDARTHGDMVRVGIAAYGLWPSKETLTALLERRMRASSRVEPAALPTLQPVLSWHEPILQVKTVPAGAYVGYGRTFRTTHDTRIAIVPVGYHEGYDRRLSNTAHVLVRGVRAPVRGRVCMNMMMVDVTDVPNVVEGDVATLIGRDGDEHVPAEQLAAWMGSINYEVVSRLHPSLRRVIVD
jgi:alanine racemase